MRLSSPGWRVRSRRLRIVVAALLVALCAGPARAAGEEAAPAPAWNAEARRLYDAGMTAYAAKAYDQAAAHFAAAQRAEPHPEILFAEAQARRLAGDCGAAADLFAAFLKTDPPAPQVEATRIALSRCEPRAAAAGAQSLSTVADDGLSRAATAAPGAPIRGPPFLGDAVGASLSAGAVGAWLVAGVYGVLAHRAQSQAEAASSYEAYASARATAERRTRWARGFAVAGGALAIGAAGRYVWARPAFDGLALGVGGRF